MSEKVCKNLNDFEVDKVYVFKMRPFRGYESEITAVVEKIDAKNKDIYISDFFRTKKRKIYELDIDKAIEFAGAVKTKGKVKTIDKAVDNSLDSDINEVINETPIEFTEIQKKQLELKKITDSIEKLKDKQRKFEKQIEKMKRKELVDNAVQGNDAKSVAIILNEELERFYDKFDSDCMEQIDIKTANDDILLSFAVIRRFYYEDKWDAIDAIHQCVEMDVSSFFPYASNISVYKDTGRDDIEYGVAIAYTYYAVVMPLQSSNNLKDNIIKSLKGVEKARRKYKHKKFK